MKKLPCPMPALPVMPREALPVVFMLELAGGVGVQQIVLQDAAFDHRRAARGHAFVVEWRRAEESRNGAVVDQRDSFVRDFLAQFAGEERRLAINRAAVDRVEDVAQQGARNARFEDHRHTLRFDFHRAQPPQRALRRFASHGLRHLQGPYNSARCVNQ